MNITNCIPLNAKRLDNHPMYLGKVWRDIFSFFLSQHCSPFLTFTMHGVLFILLMVQLYFLTNGQGTISIRPGKNCGINTEIKTQSKDRNKPCAIVMQITKDSLQKISTDIRGTCMYLFNRLPLPHDHWEDLGITGGDGTVVRPQGNGQRNEKVLFPNGGKIIHPRVHTLKRQHWAATPENLNLVSLILYESRGSPPYPLT